MESKGMLARERLLGNGVEVMNHAELIALIIRTGNREDSALGLAQKLLDRHKNDLSCLKKMSIHELMHMSGIGIAKSCSIIASFELSKRLEMQASKRLSKMDSSKDVYRLMKTYIAGLDHEQFWVIFMNNANRICSKECFSKGGITGTLVDIRMILKKALLINTTQLILCHNHPSGSLKPSKADIHLTKKIVEASRMMDIQVLDHLIITEKHYFSFADEGIM